MKNHCPKWSLPAIKRVAAKYTFLRDFRRDYHSAYKIAHRNGWLKELGLKPAPPKVNIKWTYTRTKEEAKKYKTRTDFSKNCSGAYHKALAEGWLEEFGLPKAKPKSPPNLKWTYEKTKGEASKYSRRGEFQKKNQSAYMSAWRNDWLNDFFSDC
ncbi:hypothetical protein KC851_00810 [Candidatus Kaiserbacteria bacterium]|nr:hypothetical protein [Candidatus Kaiserbacteria bacterium]